MKHRAFIILPAVAPLLALLLGWGATRVSTQNQTTDAATKQVHFYHFDRVGSTLFLTNGAGAVSDAYAYDPYGNLLRQTGASDQSFTFIGRYGVRSEPVGGLYDMRARTYDPTTARFLSRDPVWPVLGDPANLNPYQYAAQNPVTLADPGGTSATQPARIGNEDPNDPDRKPLAITNLADIPDIVDEAVRQTSYWQALTGQAGTNVDQGQRYVWVNNEGWIDLQHVISSALGPFNSIYATYNTAGLAMEVRQYLSTDPGTHESAFKLEDLRSNELGNIAYRLAEINNQSLGEAVKTLIEQMTVEGRDPTAPRGTALGQRADPSPSSFPPPPVPGSPGGWLPPDVRP